MRIQRQKTPSLPMCLINSEIQMPCVLMTSSLKPNLILKTGSKILRTEKLFPTGFVNVATLG